MKVRDFLLERYFAKYEFTVRHMLSPSDCETLSASELLEGADSEVQSLWRNLRLSYTEARGHPLLLEEIGRLTGVSAEEAIVLNPEEGIFLTLNALLDKDDHVVVLSPCYQSLYEIPKSLGCEVTRWYLKKEDGVWKLDLPFLERVVKENTRLVIINFPHNPTGFLPTLGEMNAIAELAAKKGFFVFSDEMYRGLEHDPSRRLPSAPELIRRSAALGGLSKTYGLPGLRIGWITSKDKWLLERVAALKDYTTICSSAPSEVLAVAALRKADCLADRCRGIVEKNLDLARTFFLERSGRFEWFEPLGSSVAFPRLLGNQPVKNFCERAVHDRSLMILPDSVFDVDWNHFRVGLGRSAFPEALSVLREFVD
jgi:aspartate/methionine/tyrosine aminotransferase